MVGRLHDLPLGGQECLVYIEFRGSEITQKTLQHAVDVVHAHAALRARYDPEHMIMVDTNVPPPHVREYTIGSQISQRADVRRILMQETINIEKGRNWAAAISSGPQHERVIHLVFSLAAVDLAAVGVVHEHLARVCREPDYTPAMPTTIAQVYQQHSERTCPRPRTHNDAAPAMLDGPKIDGLSSPTQAAPHMTTLRHCLSQEQWQRLEQRAHEHDVTTAALVLTLYERVIRRWSHNLDFCVTIAALNVRGTEDMVVDRTVAYAHRAYDGETFAEELAAVSTELRRCLAQQRDAMAEMRQAQVLDQPVEPSRFVFTFAPATNMFPPQAVHTLGKATTWAQTPQTAFDLRIAKIDHDTIEVAADVRDVALPPDVSEGIFTMLLEQIDDVITYGAPHAQIPREQVQQRAVANASQPCAPQLLHEGVRVHAQRNPHAVALVGPDGETVTYAQLDARARSIGARIAAVAAPGSLVAVQMPRSVEQIVALVGVLYAGCAYLPVSIEAPQARVERIRERSGWAALITADGGDLAGVDVAPLEQPVPVDPEALAYVIFTSGSTGEPKGVSISHQGARNTIDSLRQRHSIGASDTLLGTSGVDFDLSVHDVFGAFAAGARLVVVDEADARDPFTWAELVKTHGVTIWNSVPMLLEMLVATGEQLPTLRLFLVSGDWIPLDLPSRSRAMSPGSTFVAMGGATEASIWSNEYVITGEIPQHWPSIPYGLPLDGQQYRVVDARDRDVPDGCVGDLLIGGVGVANGYYNDPERTEASFLTDQDGVRWYRTGDLGLWAEGLVFFAGRRDTQVKVRGHRIECAEIEVCLSNLPGIGRAVVVPIRNRSALGAALVPHEQAQIDVPAALAHVAQQLPHYMVPASAIIVDDLPVTSNGKVDRASLIDWIERGSDLQAVETVDADDDLALVLKIWADVLGVPVPATGNFFELGGDSLTATRMCAQLRSHGFEAQLTSLFRYPNAAAFTAACQQHNEGATTDGKAEEAQQRGEDHAHSWQELAAVQEVSLDTLGLGQWCRWMWSHVLADVAGNELETVVEDDSDFFELGGDSLKAARLCADLRMSGVSVTVADVFRHPRFADFVTRCTPLETDHVEQSATTVGSVEQAFPLTPLQLAYALGADGIPGVIRTDPCVAVIVSSTDTAVQQRWRVALEAVVARHDILNLVRSGDFEQRVAPRSEPEFVELSLPMTDEQFRALLQQMDVNMQASPAVRGVVRTDRPDELGLVFNYLALDSSSVAIILRDFAQIAAGADPGTSTVSIDAFRAYVDQPPAPTQAALPPAPQIPVGTVPTEPVTFVSTGQVLTADVVQALQLRAREHAVTVNSIVLNCLAQAVTSVNGQQCVTINVPTAHRPINAEDAVGQFSQLALCTIEQNMGWEQTHAELGRAVATAGQLNVQRTTGRQRYPLVFTSLLGSALSQPLADGLVHTVWTHTRTPAVLIDCQVTPMPGGQIELRWDMPAGVVDAQFTDAAFTTFVSLVKQSAEAEPTSVEEAS
ncbi:amino acid adenylation domain-containing protein [Dermatophilus congolensis]|uniref:amino acid adenylation domain-containing protein n=1 Tax=Dermatophilus congolensis TaxID=1863 RepID=UPI001AB00BC6|nr:amino acid adenylation domain-containing protein [Dermatophilus congolensis]